MILTLLRALIVGYIDKALSVNNVDGMRLLAGPDHRYRGCHSEIAEPAEVGTAPDRRVERGNGQSTRA